MHLLNAYTNFDQPQQVDVLVLQAVTMATSNTQLLLLLLLLPAQARPATLFVTSYNCNLWQPHMCKVQLKA
jgi:hypothetical protein